MKIIFGCNNNCVEGYVTLNLFDSIETKIDVKNLELQDGSINEIMSINVFERFSPHESLAIIKEWYRVLEYGGKLVIELPDILKICRSFESANKSEKYQLLNCMYGTDLGFHFPCLFGWYDEIIFEHLYFSGFRDIRKKEPKFNYLKHNMRIECFKPNLPYGYFSLENINTYRNLIKEIPHGGTFVELGVWKGRSLCSVSDLIISKNLTVIAVDTFEGTVGEDSSLFQEAKEIDIEKQFRENIKKFCIEDKVVIKKMTTDDASKVIEEKSVDLVFIDANHEYSFIKNDIKNWKSKLKEKSSMCGHDYASRFDGVIKAVNEEFGEKIIIDNGIWIFKMETL